MSPCFSLRSLASTSQRRAVVGAHSLLSLPHPQTPILISTRHPEAGGAPFCPVFIGQPVLCSQAVLLLGNCPTWFLGSRFPLVSTTQPPLPFLLLTFASIFLPVSHHHLSYRSFSSVGLRASRQPPLPFLDSAIFLNRQSELFIPLL